MNNTGFGPPNLDDSSQQASGHYYNNASWHARKPSDGVYVPFVLGPAGTVNADLNSLAKYLMAHLEGSRGENNVLEASSFQILHQAVDGDNANQASGEILGLLLDRYGATQ
ncbi:conserved protein of unknown function, might releated with Beta-lactamase [Shewanella benthica]|uniref:Uncharacterized protein n=1 Tax=Shewanella benthica TaxID=43661 RepID=A0A330M0C8_9GAMM|nr:conserved protein of unknown function, might releated with Beta-lactamase [Shewanella benthica]